MSDESDLHRRVTLIEANNETIRRDQEMLRKNQEDITRDLKEMSSNLNEVTNNLALLVNNTSHLTEAVDRLAAMSEKAHQIELDLTVMKSRTDTINKLWDTVDIMKAKLDSQSTITSGIKWVAGSVMTGAIGLILIHLFGGK